MFGDNEDQVVNQLGGLGGGGGDLFKKLLPLLAPLVMGFLAKQFTNRGGSESSAAVQQTGLGGGGLGDLSVVVAVASATSSAACSAAAVAVAVWATCSAGSSAAAAAERQGQRWRRPW